MGFGGFDGSEYGLFGPAGSEKMLPPPIKSGSSFNTGLSNLMKDIVERIFPRPRIMDNVVSRAFREPVDPKEIKERNVDKNSRTTLAYFRVRDWRYDQRYHPESFAKSFPDPATRPTKYELRDVENQLYAQMHVETE